MSNEQAQELLALMAQQLQAVDRQTEIFERRFTQLNETMLNGFLRLEDKFDKKTDALAERLDHLTEEVREVKAEAQVTNRRLQATFEHTGFLTEENTDKEARLVKLERSNVELRTRLLIIENKLNAA